VAAAAGLDIRIRLGKWTEIRQALERGEIDAVQGIFYSEDRDQRVDFSQAHIVNHYVAVARKEDAPPPSTVAELADKRIVVQDGDIMEGFCRKHGLMQNVTVVDSQETALRELAAGQHDIALVARMSAFYWIEQYGWKNISVGSKALASLEYCFGVPHGSKGLLAQLSEGLTAISQSGEYRRIHEKWLGVYGGHFVWADILKYILLVAGPLFLIAVIALSWSWSLRQKVTDRTRDLRERLLYEKLLTRISVLAMETADLDVYLNQCLADMGRTMDVSRSYVFEYHDQTNTFDNTFEWVAEGVSPQKDNMQDISAAEVPWWTALLQRNEIINFTDIEDIPDEKTKAIIRAQNIRSVLILPLFTSGQFYGFLGFDDCVQNRKWSDTDAEILQAVGRIMIGVIEQHRAETALRRLSTAIEQSPETIMITDPDGMIQYVNPAFEKTTGYTREEALGQNPGILRSGQQNAAFYATMWNTLQSGRVWEGRLVNKCKDGALYTEEASIAPVKDSNGTITNYVAVKRDITSELKLETQLRQAQKMQSVGRLAGGVAHDFNNLLMGIMGYTELSRDELSEDHPARRWLDEITREVKRSADLTRQLLAFARKQTVAPRVINLNDTIGNMFKMLRRLIGEDIELVWEPGPELWSVKIDPVQVDQMLANLCVNARDAIVGAGKITIETGNVHIDAEDCVEHVEAKVGPYVMLAVSDDGCGMDQEARENIFEPFFTTKPVGEGTGLGLATIYGIVKQNNGFVGVYSEPGKGTTFRLYLPRATCASTGETQGDEQIASPGGAETILLVEDEAAIRVTLQRLLSRLGYNVIEAESPVAALDRMSEWHDQIDLLLTDVVMPGMNGRELVERMKSDCPNMKVLYMSGYTAEAIAHHGILDEGVNFISKPIGREALAQKVREVLG
jgi:PAS domain S-box-containing protein